MLEKTNIRNCKDIAKQFLRLKIETTQIPFIVAHPFFECPMIIQDEKMVNIVEDKEAYRKAIIQLEKQIEEIEEFEDLILLIRKPYKLVFLKYTKEWLSLKDFSTQLIEAWTIDEYANNNINVSKNTLRTYLKNADKKHLMTKEEKSYLEKIDDVVTVYRGLTEYNQNNIKALSWTLDKNKAIWFATRFSNYQENIKKEHKCFLYKAKIKKNDIFAYCDSRNEKEVILDYTKLIDIEKINLF